jgi:two-component system chemotaxis response regulator CheB
MRTDPIRTLVVDDSALVRKIVVESLSQFPDIEVIGTATDPYIARDKILQLKPQVITLDIEMPRMDGLTFLRLLMKHHPVPVIILSSLTSAGSEKAMEALQAGAVDVMAKPAGSLSAHEDGSRLAEKIRAAACARLRKSFQSVTPVSIAKPEPKRPWVRPADPASSRNLVVIGASTGGTEALKSVLTGLTARDLPGICIVQHIPAGFSLAFANRMNQLCPFEVKEAVSGDLVCPGRVLIAPGGYHMILRWTGKEYLVQLNEGPKLHHQRPAVDALFDSVVKAGGSPHCLAILLTGMGSDGAMGLLRLRETGAATIAQNEETCVVFGMPREAIRLGAAQRVLPLDDMAREIERFALRGCEGVKPRAHCVGG